MARDARGNITIVEVMVVAVFVVIAMAAVSTFTPHNGDIAHDSPYQQGHLCSFLDTYSLQPSTNDTIRFGSGFEEWAIQSINEENRILYEGMQTEWLGADTRLTFQHNNDVLPVVGSQRMPLGPNEACQREFHAQWGATLIRTGMSHYTSLQAIDLQLLPILAGGLPTQSGIPYDVTTRLEDDEGRSFHQYAHGHVRTQHDEALAPIEVAFEGPGGGRIQSAAADDLLVDLGAGQTTWQVRVNLTADQADAAEVWWTSGHILRVQAPAGWTFDGLTPAGDWSYLPETPGSHDASKRIKYSGTALRGPDAGVTLTVNLTRPLASDAGQNEFLTVWTDGERTSNNHLVLRPASVLREGPFAVHTSRSEPWTSTQESPFRVHVTNPRMEPYTLKDVVVTFSNDSYQFRALADSLPSGWSHEEVDNDVVRFVWQGEEELSSGETHVLEFPGWLVKPKWTSYHEFVAPTLNVLHGEDLVHRVVGDPMGGSGQYRVTLPPMLELGEHAVTVGNSETGAPPGRGAYVVGTEGVGVLDEVQTARYTMNLEASPRTHGAGESVELAVETGGLLATLRSLGVVDPDTVRINVTTTDLLGYFTEDYHAQAEFPLKLDTGSQVMGIDFLDVNGLALDVIVTYADGHVVALDGDLLPSTRLWRVDLGLDVTSPPVLLDVDGLPGDELVVAASRGEDHRLVALDASGGIVSEVVLEGRPSHVVASGCRAGVWFQESDMGRASVAPQLKGGFLSEPPLSTRLAHWEPGVGVTRGPDWVGANPYTVEEGRFAPFGGCGVVQALGYDLDSDPRVLLLRSDAQSLEEVWRFEGDGRVRGTWVRDTATTPIETPSVWNAAPARSDEVILVTDEFGLEVLSGWVVHERVEKQSMPGMVPADKPLGLSWVDRETGYVASKWGYVWKTVDAGENWVMTDDSPVVTAPRSLTDFVFGGNGKGLLVRDDQKVGAYPAPPGQDVTFELSGVHTLHGVGAAFDAAGVVGFADDLAVTGLFEWPDGVLARDAKIAVHCDCSASGHGEALLGQVANDVYIANKSASRFIPALGSSASGQGDTAVLAFDAGALVVNRTDAEAEHVDIDVHDITPMPAPIAGAHTASADIVHGPYLYSLDGDHLVKHQVDSTNLIGVSTGYGPKWVVDEIAVAPAQVSGSYWYAIRPGSDIGDEDSVTITIPDLDFGLIDPYDFEWRLHTPDGVRHVLLPGASLDLTWTNGTLLEARFLGSDSPLGTGPTLSIDTESGELLLASEADPTCDECLIPIGRPEAVRHTDRVWSHAAGFLPSVRLPTIGPEPVLVDRAGAAPLLVAGHPTSGLYSFSVDSALTKAPVETSFLGSEQAVRLGVTSTPSGSDELWAEAGVDPVGVVGVSGIIPAESLNDRVAPKFIRINAETGVAWCDAAWAETDRLGHRLVVAHPEADGMMFSGSGLGRLGHIMNGCSPLWETEVAETGSRLVLTIEPPERDWLGTRVYLVDIIVDVDGIGEVRVQLMDHSRRIDHEFPRKELWYWANLFVWDTTSLWRG